MLPGIWAQVELFARLRSLLGTKFCAKFGWCGCPFIIFNWNLNHQKCGWQGLSVVDWCQAESTRNLGEETIIRRYPNCPDNHVTALQKQTLPRANLSNIAFLPGISATTFVVETGGKHGIGCWVTNYRKDTVHDVEPLKWFFFWLHSCTKSRV